MTKLTHIDEDGRVRMIDVSGKATTERNATAEAFVRMSCATANAKAYLPATPPW